MAEKKEKKITSFEELPKIVAVDFDGTLVEDEFPNIGKPNEEMFNFLKYLRQEQGVKLVLWTSRNFSEKYGDLLEQAVEFCQSKGLEFDAINENIQEVQDFTGEDTRKIYADVYIDDKSVPAIQSPIYWVYKLGFSWLDIKNNGVI
jgi:hydroxymethylpyrimidine pyrophosphatase-like HAD family hydrolase